MEKILATYREQKIYKVFCVFLIIICAFYTIWAPLRYFNKIPGYNSYGIWKGGYSDHTSGFTESEILSTCTNYSWQSHLFGDMEIFEDIMYLAAGNEGLWIFEMNEYYEPNLLSQHDYPEGVWGLTISQDKLFMATGDDGLTIINISSPRTPTIISVFTNSSTNWTTNSSIYNNYLSRNIILNSEILYISDKNRGFSVINISNIEVPFWVRQCYNGSGVVNDMVQAGNRLYVADCCDGLEIFSVSDPANPIKLGYYNDGNPDPDEYWSPRAMGLDIVENYIYLADSFDCLEILDVSDPSNPIEVSQLLDIHQSESGYAVKIIGDFLYYIARYNPVIVFKIEFREHPVAVAFTWIQYLGPGYIISAARTTFEVINEDVIVLIDVLGYINSISFGRDADGDYMSDRWENMTGIDDPVEDIDSDGLTNYQEYVLGTDPYVSRFSTFYYVLYGFTGVGLIGATTIFIILVKKDSKFKIRWWKYR